MTRDEGVALIKQQLAFRRTLDSAIVDQLKFAQTTLEAAPTKPWFLVSEDSYALTTADEERVAVPGDFLEEVEDARFYYRPDDFPDSDEVELKKEDYDQLKRDFLQVPSGPPQAYALLGDYFRIFPLPDAAYTVRLIYFKPDTTLDTNVENGWLKHIPMLLLGSALKLIAEGPVRDVQAGKIADQWIATGSTLLHKRNEQRKAANREDQIGGRHW